MVERQLPKLNVAGSIPVSRSIKMNKMPKRWAWSVVQIWATLLSAYVETASPLTRSLTLMWA